MNADHAIELSGACWRKSSFSGSGGTSCVEVAQAGRMIAVRDSKNPGEAVLTFTEPEWKAFTRAVKASEFDC
ncbi:MAG: DUF397 domain-containing protein [Streptosporangiaceae bacterium]|nr:DUF397 domain-containing protein [Streptosporangiaceae bacterium]